jgi:hypothetical protein
MVSKTPQIMIAALAGLFLSACHDTTAVTRSADNLSVRATKGVQPTSLIVTVDDQSPSGPYRIQSDGLGDYVDGVQTIFAQIDEFGNLEFGPRPAQASLARTLRFDFSAPADPNNTYRPDESGQQLWKIKTNPNVVPGTPRITDLGVNGNPVSACYGSTVAHQNAAISYRAIFNTASDPQGTNVFITRTSVSPAAWTMISSGPCGGTANRAALYSDPLADKHPVIVFRGYYDLSFSLRLRAR